MNIKNINSAFPEDDGGFSKLYYEMYDKLQTVIKYPSKNCVESMVKTPIMAKCKLKWFGHVKRSRLPVKAIFEGMMEEQIKKRKTAKKIKEWTKLEWNETNTKMSMHTRFNGE